MPNTLEPHSPEWWIARLWQRLNERTARIQLYDDYYSGKQKLRFTTSKARETFGQEFGGFADNFCLLVVDAVEERLQVRGFRVGGAADLDTDVAAIWKRNDMNVGASMLHTEALVNEQAYAIVWTNPDDRTKAQITVESPFEVITECDRAYRTNRKAALKRWLDPDDRKWRAVLYLADAIYKFVSAAPRQASSNATAAVGKPGFWQPWTIEGEPWPLPNPLNRVPVVPFTNMPRLGPDQGGTSEIAAVVPLQDWLNKGAFDELIASEFVAFPQRVLVNVDIPTDEQGNPIAEFKAGVNRYWFLKGTPGGPDPRVDQFPQANLQPYTEAIAEKISHMAAITKTPRHYLIDDGGGTNLSGETIKAFEAGLVSKTRRKQGTFGEAWEEAVALALRIEKGGEWVAEDDDRIEIEWGDPETRTEAQHVDAVVKKGSAPINLPQEQVWKELGYTDEEIQRFHAMIAAGQTSAPAPPPPPAVVGGQPGTAPVDATTSAAEDGAAATTPATNQIAA